MHLFRSILNAHFLRYVTLVIVACFGFSTHINVDVQLSETSSLSITEIHTYFPTALADETDDNNNAAFNEFYAEKDRKINSIDTTFIKILNVVIAAISFLYVPFSMLSGWLLSPDWTFGDFIHLRPVLHSLWIFVSNTVYVVFAAMLIVVAIANIFGQSDSYAIKKMLPRFIIGVIMVPFTWWMVSATLSVSSYMTALVLRMPADMITASNSPEYEVNVPQKCNLDFTTSTTSKVWDCDPPTKKPISQFLKSDNAYGIIPLYAYNIFKFDDLDTFKSALNDTSNLTEAQKTEILAADKDAQSMLLQAALIATGLAKIGVQLFMSVLFALVFMIILIALVLVLFTRVIKMWMYAIFSPLFALRYFLSDKIDKDNAIAKFDFKEFVGLAMVPVVVSGALSFGFLFLMTFKTHMEQPISKTPDGVSAQKGIDSQFVYVKNESSASNGSINFFGIEIGIKLPEGSTKSANGSNADNLSVALMNVLSGLITPILGVIILWMAVMAAMKTSAVAGEAVKSIEGFGDQVAGMAKKLPGFLPVPGMTVKGADGKEKPMTFKHFDAVKRSLLEIPGTMESKAYTEVQKTWFNKDTVDDMMQALNGAGKNIDKLGIIADRMAQKNTNISSLSNDENVQKGWKHLVLKSVTEPTKQKEITDLIDAGRLADALKKLGESGINWGPNTTQINAALKAIKPSSSGDELRKIAELAGVTIAKKFAMTHPPTINGTNITLNYTDGTAGSSKQIDWTNQKDKPTIEAWLKQEFGEDTFEGSALSEIADHILAQRPTHP